MVADPCVPLPSQFILTVSQTDNFISTPFRSAHCDKFVVQCKVMKIQMLKAKDMQKTDLKDIPIRQRYMLSKKEVRLLEYPAHILDYMYAYISVRPYTEEGTFYLSN